MLTRSSVLFHDSCETKAQHLSCGFEQGTPKTKKSVQQEDLFDRDQHVSEQQGVVLSMLDAVSLTTAIALQHFKVHARHTLILALTVFQHST